MPAAVPDPKRRRIALLVGSEAATSGLAEECAKRGFGSAACGVSEAAGKIDSSAAELLIAAELAGEDLESLCELAGDVPVIAVLSRAGDAEERRALRAGAVATLARPWTDDEARLALERALAGMAATSSDATPPHPSRKRGLLGRSEPMQRVVDLIGRTAPVMATALVRGETGTGKEVVARALHDESPRRAGPFVKVHCAALPDNLLESELFGYEKGAFTGATARKPGRVELAEGGTLFLDEIGDITPATQVKLLRLLQDREYERLGGVVSLRADVRFVAATHRDLEGMVKRGEFREDLFYRLNVVTLWLPPLRARRDDIELLALEFCGEFARAYGKDVKLDETAIRALRSERWPGNVRQLQNFVERLVVLATDSVIGAEHVKGEMSEQVAFKTQVTMAPSGSPALADDPLPSSRALPLGDAVRAAEKKAIERALRQASGNRTVAARILGVSRATLYTKLEEHGIG